MSSASLDPPELESYIHERSGTLTIALGSIMEG